MRKFLTQNFLIGIIASTFSWLGASAQIVINEICPTNINIITNSNDNYDDWFELHNAGTTSVNLAGYGLTDELDKPFKFTFPNYSLGSEQKVIVFASDHSTQQIADHWEMPVNAGAIWKYTFGSVAIDTNWRNISFNESAWSSGYGGIGFGDADDNTTIPVGVSVMMRKTFTVSDTSQIVKGVFLMDYDDGFVAYLNGVEIARANIGTAGFRPAWNDLATNSHEAKSYRGLPIDSFYISPTLMKSAIRPGINVLSIEVHNTPANSDDLTSIPYLFFGIRTPGLTYIQKPSWFHVPVKEYFNTKFKLSASGETLYLFNPAGVNIDQKTYPLVAINHSYCRIPDGSSNWCYVNSPTPEATNNSSTCFTSYATAPVFSKQGGFYSTTQSILITNSTPGGVIRYTINGDTPIPSSPAYSGPISVSATKTIRAIVFSNGYLPSPLVTNTYIIGKTTHLSTFSITTDSLNLWDYNTGIYATGPNAAATTPYKGANYWMDWEKPATIEYYDKNKNQVVKFDCDIKIYGNYSRAKPQKSFEIKLRDSYGIGSFDYQMYPGKSWVDKVDNIILRNSGTDWNKVHFRDGMMERLLKTTNTGYLAAEPAIAYLNGQYWGVYQIDENHDQHWMKNNFGYDRKEIDYLKEAGTTVFVQEGSDQSFWTMYNYATTQSATSSLYYDDMNSMLDLKNYTDYFVAETFYNNGDWIGDWTNNIKMWKPKKSGAKWRYLVYDLDYGLGLKGTVTDNRLGMARNPAAFSYSSEMFDAMLKNPAYKRYFINRYADLMNTIFLPSNINSVMKSFKDSMSFDMPAHFAKWGSSTNTWNSEISNMMSFANARPDIMKNYIKSEFGMSGIVALTILTSPTGSGRIEISTVTPTTYPWTGDYFNGNPVTITAIPNPGYTFDHWRSQKVITSNNPNQSVTYNFNRDDKITAYFAGSSVTPKLCVSELNYNADSAYNSGDWIELHNYGTTALDISGWKLSDGNDNHNFVFPTGTKIAINGYLVLVEDSNKFKATYPNVTNRIGLTGFNFSNAGDQIRIFNHLNALYLSFNYMNLAPWPELADGKGYTLELLSNTSNPNAATSWFAGCLGGSPGKAYSATTGVPVSVTGSTTFCSGSSTVLNASRVLGNTFQWKKNGAIVNGAADSVYSATTAGNYTVVISNHGCSAESPALAVSTVSQQPIPVTTAAARCGPGELTLSATSSDSVYWYDASTGGNLVYTGNTFFIPYLQQSKTYFAKTGRNCPSNPVATLADIMLPSAAPVTGDASRCGPGIITLTANAADDIRWYNATSGGGLLATGTSFTTNNLNNDTAFFVETGNICPSSRIEIRVTISMSLSPVVADGSRCGNGAVVLSAVSADPVFWYKTQSGGALLGTGATFTTPVISETDTFYVEANGGCPSARMMVLAFVNPVPADPIISDVIVCDAGSAEFTADATEQVNWFTSSTSVNSIFTGTVFTTPAITSSTIYYASNGYTCQSNRVAVNAILSSTPALPVTNNVLRCDSGSITLNASSPQSVYWYDAAVNGNLLANSPSYTTPVLTASATYYVEAGNDCKTSRIAVQAIIGSYPIAPLTADASRCGSGQLTLVASSAEQISWYTAATGGVALATGPNFLTPLLNSTTTYYVGAGNSGCGSTRVVVNAIINAIPAAPIASDKSNCGAGTIVLQATSSEQLFWYDSQTDTNLLGTGSTFITPYLTSSTTYYVETGNTCISNRIPVNAIITATLINSVTNGYNCGPGMITLSAASSLSADSIKWYNQPGGTVIATGATFTTPVLTASTTYYVSANSDCSGSPVSVNAVINPFPVINLGPDLTIASGQTIVLNAGAGYSNYLWSTNATTSQINVNAQGTYAVTITDNNGCTASDDIVVNILTAVNNIEGNNSIKIYPNPTSGKVTIEVSDIPSKVVTVKLISIQGKILRTEEIKIINGQLNKTIQLEGISAGIYYLEIMSEKYKNTLKVIKE